MPLTLWDEIVGYTCVGCGRWATHFYGNTPICCSCHLGEEETMMAEEAIKVNTIFQKQGNLEGYMQ